MLWYTASLILYEVTYNHKKKFFETNKIVKNSSYSLYERKVCYIVPLLTEVEGSLCVGIS